MTRKELLTQLLSDIAAGNAWRLENPNEPIDLSGVNLQGANLGSVDLSRVELRHTN